MEQGTVLDDLVAEFAALTSEIEDCRAKMIDLSARRITVVRRMHYDEGLSMRQIGTRCGLSAPRVHDLIHAA